MSGADSARVEVHPLLIRSRGKVRWDERCRSGDEPCWRVFGQAGEVLRRYVFCHPERSEGPGVRSSWLVWPRTTQTRSLVAPLLGMTVGMFVIPSEARDLAYGHRGLAGYGQGRPGPSSVLRTSSG